MSLSGIVKISRTDPKNESELEEQMARNIKSIPGLKNYYKELPEEIRGFFEHFETLLDREIPLKVCLAYVFSEMERAQHEILYYATCKIHKTEKDLTRQIVDKQHMTREKFEYLYEVICDMKTPSNKDYKDALKTRDNVIHGKKTSDDDMRNAIASVMDYAAKINQAFDEKHGFEPIRRSYQGFLGRRPENILETKTTRFVLKGLGFEHVS